MDDQVRARLGRPRRVDDEAVFLAVGTVLLRVGLPRLGLNLVADEVGVTPAALRQRFGAKTELLVAYQRWATQQVRARLSVMLATHGQPLDALRELARTSVAQIDDPDQLANALSVYTDASDPRIHALTAERLELAVEYTTELLDRAIAEGIIRGITGRTLAQHLQHCLIGACMTWSMTRPEHPLDAEISAATDLVLAPYLHTTATESRKET